MDKCAFCRNPTNNHEIWCYAQGTDEHKLERLAQAVPFGLYPSKTWQDSNLLERVEWLKSMYASAKEETLLWIAQCEQIADENNRITGERDTAKERIATLELERTALRNEVRKDAEKVQNYKALYAEKEAENRALEAAQKPDCRWIADGDGCEIEAYDTSCGERFAFNEGGPADNKAAFCQYCGGKLIEVPVEGDDAIALGREL